MPSNLEQRLAELIVNFGANIQPGQIVDIGSGLGKEGLTRAITASAYKRGAKFVDVSYWDPYLKRERVKYAPDEVLDFVPPWYGERTLKLGEERGATISLSGPIAPHLFDDLANQIAERDANFVPHAATIQPDEARANDLRPDADDAVRHCGGIGRIGAARCLWHSGN